MPTVRTQNINRIIDQIRNLNRSTGAIWGADTKYQAPHKPFLLLTIIDGFEFGWIQSNRIRLDESLIDGFRRYWTYLIPERDGRVEYPFYYMNSEPFWKLKTFHKLPNYEFKASLSSLHPDKVYAELNDEWYELLRDTYFRRMLRDLIVSQFFSIDAASKLSACQNDLNETFAAVADLDEYLLNDFTLDHTTFSEPKFTTRSLQVRENAFRLKVKNNYNHHCAICKLRVLSTSGQSIVDAAHIVPIHISQNNDPRNGLSLCKNHHWMFDQYLLSVNPAGYKIEISNLISIADNKIGNTLEFQGKPLELPKEKHYSPAFEAIDYHYQLFRKLSA